jgi:DNA recombination protein RmuC
MPAVEIALGICIVVAGILGLLLGRNLGTSALKAEIRVRNENLEVLSSEKKRLEEQGAQQSALIQRQGEQIARAEERGTAQEQKYAQMKADVDKAFADLASKALRDNNESFLALAKRELGGQTQEAKQALEAKELAIKNLIDPVEKALKSLDEQTREMEKERSTAYGEVKTLVDGMQKSIPASIESLRNETSQLITALRAPKTRGNWGELQLKRCVEYAGMVEHCSFHEQASARTEDDRLLRPDLTIDLPNKRTIIVDAKTPLDAFLDASGSHDPASQALRFMAHAERVRAHLRELAGKAYWKQFEHTPEFVVCFLPSEALFSAALEADPSLIEFGSQANVVMATPTTLIALLKAVAYGWQQSEVTQNAKAIQEAGRDLYNKLVNAHEYFSKLGAALENAVGNFNRFIGAVEGKQGAFSQARKLRALVHDQEEIEVLEPHAAEPRQLTADDWESVPSLAIAAEAGESNKSEV